MVIVGGVVAVVPAVAVDAVVVVLISIVIPFLIYLLCNFDLGWSLLETREAKQRGGEEIGSS